MRILVAFDSFKGCASSLELGKIASSVIESFSLQSDIVAMADGGEGSLQAIKNSVKNIKVDGANIGGANQGANIENANIKNLKVVKNMVKGPNYQDIDSHYCVINEKTAIIEIALCSGYLFANPKNPYFTTSYGVGQLIRHALNSNINDFIIALGGSASNDAGIGMLRALGLRFLDSKGEIKDAKDIGRIESFDFSDFDKRLKDCHFKIACDVSNPFFGKDGASLVFGMQKGASREMAERLDSNFLHFAGVIKNLLNKDIQIAGAGAAGGLGGAFLVFLNATLQSGAEIFMDLLSFEERLKKCDIVITGEGKSDFQTKFGKMPCKVLELARKHGKMAYLFSGRVENLELDFDGIYEISPKDMPLKEAMENVDSLLKSAVSTWLRNEILR